MPVLVCSAPSSPRSPVAEARLSAPPQTSAALTWDRLAVLALFLVATLPYLGCLGHEFLGWDDRRIILEQPFLRELSLENLWTIFSPVPAREEWLPLRDLTLALDFALLGPDPWHFALVNLLLHGAATLAAWGLFRELCARREAALFGALLFACHAAHVESVAWLGARKDPLSLLFLLLALRGWVRYRKGAGARGLLWAWAWFALALLSKANAFVLPAWLLTYDLLLWPGERWRTRPWRTRIAPLVPFALLGLAHVWTYVRLTKADGVIEPYPPGGLETVLRTDVVSLVDYMRYLALPLEHQAIYDHVFRQSWADPRVLGSLLILCLLAGVAWRERARRPLVTWCLCFAAASLLPYMNLIPHGIYYAERYTYLPSLVAALLLGSALASVRARSGRTSGRVILAGLALWLAGQAGLSAWRSRVWSDDETFWTYQVAQIPHNPAPRMNLAEAYEFAQRYEDAARIYGSLSEGALVVPQAVYRLGRIARRLGRVDAAIGYYERYRSLDPQDPPLYNNLAEAYFARGDAAQAIEVLEEGIRVAPNYIRARRTLAIVLEQQGREAEARRQWEEILARVRLQPDLRFAAEARARLGR